MKSAQQRSTLRKAVVGVPLLLIAVVAVQMRIDSTAQAMTPPSAELLIRSAPALKKMSLGYDALVADIYWTRAVQYYGSRVSEPGANYDLLWPLLDVATTLDPHLIVAYRFGAIFLSEPYAGANRTDLAVQLVKRGIAANPDQWRMGSDLGLLYYLRLRNYKLASEAYLETSKIPGAPPSLKLLAGRIAQQGGSIDTARVIWSQLYESTTDANIKTHALRQLRSLKAQDDEAHLDDLFAEYARRTGHRPVRFQDLIAAGMLTGVPADPAGFPYVIGPDGNVQLSPSSSVEIVPAASLPPQPPQ